MQKAYPPAYATVPYPHTPVCSLQSQHSILGGLNCHMVRHREDVPIASDGRMSNRLVSFQDLVEGQAAEEAMSVIGYEKGSVLVLTDAPGAAGILSGRPPASRQADGGRMRMLNVWDGERHIGVFTEAAGQVLFSYDDDVDYPISLSLPVASPVHAAAAMFLEGLLPEDDDDRLRVQIATGAQTDGAFDLLDGVDAAGGLVFSASDERPELERTGPTPMTEEDFERLLRMRGGHSNWWDEDSKARFLLAGNQKKFTVAVIGGRRFWPSAAVPSTAIYKPEPREFPWCSVYEHVCEVLAASCGIPAPQTSVLEVNGERVYSIERFDRVLGPDGTVRRVRTEDLTQALSVPSLHKYDVELADALNLLASIDSTGDLPYELLEQVAFNTYVGNADAHAKNYSLFLSREGASLCPLYDCVPTYVYPGLSRGLAMSVNGKWYSEEIGLSDWEAEAVMNGLDGDRAVETVGRVLAGIHACAEEAMSELPGAQKDELSRVLRLTFRRVSGDVELFAPKPLCSRPSARTSRKSR